jgi:diguanylate cyclase (GGDEF)-like protein
MELAQTLIHKPVSEVFSAFLDSEQRRHFWFANSEQRWVAGQRMQWTSPLYSQQADVFLRTLEPNKEIVVEWSDPPCVITIRFRSGFSGATLVTICGVGFSHEKTPISAQILALSKLYCKVLASLKAHLENNIEWDLMAEHIRAHGETLHCLPVYQSSLTKLPDLRALLERFRRSPPEQLACFDIDRMMPFNDHFGHQEGDRAIIAVARCLRSSLESRELYQVGGDEFAACRVDKSESEVAFRDAMEAAQKAVEALGIPYFHPEVRTSKNVLTVSCGFSSSDLSGVKSMDTLNKMLDEANRLRS